MIAEIEHFADQELDDVPKFDNVQDLKVAFPAAQRQNGATGDEPEAVLMTHNEAFGFSEGYSSQNDGLLHWHGTRPHRRVLRRARINYISYMIDYQSVTVSIAKVKIQLVFKIFNCDHFFLIINSDLNMSPI